MFCSIAGAVYDILGYVHPFMTLPHGGMKFSTLSTDYDLLPIFNCAPIYGGSWWYLQCLIWSPTVAYPIWYVLGDDSWRVMESARMMVKLQ